MYASLAVFPRGGFVSYGNLRSLLLKQCSEVLTRAICCIFIAENAVTEYLMCGVSNCDERMLEIWF